MMIYNTVDNPVIITLGDKTYRMERDSELELKIPSGEYFIRLHKVDRKDRLITTEYSGGGRHSRGTTYICLGMTALLNLRKDTKVCIRETEEQLVTIPSEFYEQLRFDVLVDNGELTHRQDGYLDNSVSKKMTRNFYVGLIGSIIGNMIVAVGGCVLAGMLLDFFRENGASKEDVLELLFIILVPILCVGGIVISFSKFKRADVFKQIPILPDKSYYDYL